VADTGKLALAVEREGGPRPCFSVFLQLDETLMDGMVVGGKQIVGVHPLLDPRPF
jgi:hypothetical protein